MTVKGTTLPTTLWIVSSTSSDDGQNDHNGSEEEARRQVLIRSLHVCTTVICSTVFLLGVTGNGLVIFITGFRMKRTVNTIWFLNLAVADFLFTFFLPFSVAYTALGFQWPFGIAFCKFNSGLAFLNLYASIYLLMAISIDRCIFVVRPVWAQTHRTPRLATLVTLAVWVVALVLSSPNVYFRHTAPSFHNKTIICYNDFISSGEGATEEQRDESENINQRAIIISRFVFSFLIPFTVILCCYGAILIKLKRNHWARSSKPFKVIAAVIITFFFCCFPYYVFSFLEMHFSPSLQNALIIGLPLTASLAFINSCLNPIIYIFMGQDFKKRIRFSLFSAFKNAFSEGTARTVRKNKSCMETDPMSSRHHVPIESGKLELCST